MAETEQLEIDALRKKCQEFEAALESARRANVYLKSMIQKMTQEAVYKPESRPYGTAVETTQSLAE